jgi:hypothetical protein
LTPNRRARHENRTQDPRILWNDIQVAVVMVFIIDMLIPGPSTNFDRLEFLTLGTKDYLPDG